jgi:hypothetical protein
VMGEKHLHVLSPQKRRNTECFLLF